MIESRHKFKDALLVYIENLVTFPVFKFRNARHKLLPIRRKLK